MPEPSDPVFPEMPDFCRWQRSRLELLLDDYRGSLKHINSIYGKNHAEYALYSRWIKAIEEELHRRDE
jgi:hypothetical protein